MLSKRQYRRPVARLVLVIVKSVSDGSRPAMRARPDLPSGGLAAAKESLRELGP